MIPVLLQELANRGGEARPRDLYGPVASHFPDISSDDLDESQPSGPNKWQNRVQWARWKLVEAGLIDNSTYGVWRLTDKGHVVAASLPTNLDPLNEALAATPTEVPPSADVLSWVFQSNPERFDVLAATGRNDSMGVWSMNQHRELVHDGQRVYFYQSGSRAGIYAVGTALGDAYEANEDEFGRWKVSVRFDAIVDPPLLRNELLADPALAASGSSPVGRAPMCLRRPK